MSDEDEATQIECPACGAMNAPAFVHCHACGRPLGGPRYHESRTFPAIATALEAVLAASNVVEKGEVHGLDELVEEARALVATFDRYRRDPPDWERRQLDIARAEAVLARLRAILEPA